MEEYDYIERRRQLRQIRRKPPKRREGFFFLRLNMALALGITVLCANMIDLDITNSFTQRLSRAVKENTDITELETKVKNVITGFSDDEGISVFAKEPPSITMDDTLISEMNEKAAAYENAQKKTSP